MQKLLREVEKYTIYITVFLVPVVFLPTFADAFLTAKIAILVLGVSLAFVFRLIRVGTTGSFEFNQGTFDFPVFLLIVAYLLSGIYASPNKPEAFFLPGAATVIIASGLLYFLANQLESEEKDKLMYILIGSGFLASLVFLVALTGLFENIQSLPAFMRTRNFTLQGALLPTAIFLLTIIPYSIGLILRAKDYLFKVILGSATAIIGISLLISTFNMITERDNFLIASFDASLSVTFDSLKNSAVLGVGPSNYLSAYTRFRPLSVNQQKDWLARYSHSRNFYLTAITETGFVGTFALVLLLLVLFKMANSEIKAREHKRVPILDYKTASIVILFAILAIFPATSPEIFLVMFIGLAMASKTKRFRLGVAASSQADSRTSKLPAVVVITPILVGIIYLFVVGGKSLAAERTYKSSLDLLAKNEGTKAYEALQQAINANPMIDRYHSTYSQVNFLLAEAVARKENVSDSDRQTITQLIQQSIREARTSVALNPRRAGNWQILGATYRNIMALSQDAATFAIQSYSQAVVLDPVNPDLRIALGGIWYAAKNYDNAIDTFKLAVIAKPDHANARYNLAAAYREKGDTTRAIAELKVVLTLVDENSKDYETAKKELEALEAKKEAKPTEGESLTPPSETKPIINPPIELPEDSGPEGLTSPTPSASGTPSPSPNQ